MSKVAIYARVSTIDKQDYKRQISDLKSIISQHKYSESDIEIFAEKISGYTNDKERPELTRLLDIIKENNTTFKCIYITEISRLGRNPKNTREIIDDLTERGIPIYIQTIGQYTMVDGKRNIIVSIILQVLMEFADLESQTTKNRMKSGKLQAVKEGRVSGNNQAFGYMGDSNKKLIINPEESFVVEKIFELYRDGYGMLAIANTLNQMKIPTRLNRTHSDKLIKSTKTDIVKKGDSITWSGNTIRQILINTIYKGKRVYKDIIVDVPAIISEELFDECNKKIKEKVTKNTKTTYQYLLKNLIKCGCCGRNYYGRYQPLKKGDKIYKCSSSLANNVVCDNMSINISLIESIIFNEMLNSEALFKIIDNSSEIKKEIETDIKRGSQELLNEEKNLDSKQKQLKKLLALYLSTDDYDEELYNDNQLKINRDIQISKDKIILIKKELLDKNLALSNYNEEKASKDMLVDAKHNRHELTKIINQFIHKIIINNLNQDYTLLTIYIKINGIVLINTLKIFIYISGVRSVSFNTKKKYKYIGITKMENDPVFKNNTFLMNKNEILEELENIIFYSNQEESELFNKPKFIEVPEENYLYINPNDI